MKSGNKKTGEKCQGILRESSQWCNWDMKRKRRVRKKKNEKGGGKEKEVEIQEKEEQLIINLYYEAKLMNEESWIETTTRRFSNHESRLISRSHTFAIIVILDLKIQIKVCGYTDPFFQKLEPKVIDP